MRRHIIVGKTNAGKTLFCIRFAQFLGVREITWLVERTDGRTEQKRMSLAEAQQVLSGIQAHTTRNLQSIHLEVPRGKTARPFLLTDSTGLVDGIHPETEVRDAMAQTLQALLDAHAVLHIVDACAIGRSLEADGTKAEAWGPLDEQVAAFGMQRGGYLLLANKMDLPPARQGYKFLAKRYPKSKVIPVSALCTTGFREVRDYVWRLA